MKIETSAAWMPCINLSLTKEEAHALWLGLDINQNNTCRTVNAALNQFAHEAAKSQKQK